MFFIVAKSFLLEKTHLQNELNVKARKPDGTEFISIVKMAGNLRSVSSFLKYIITAMARTRIARLPWMIRTLFSVPTKFFQQLKKTNIWGFFLFYHGIVCCVYSLESPHRSDSNEYTQHSIIVEKIENISRNYRYLLPELVP